MPRLTAITTCKGRLEHLKATLPGLIADPELEVVVVDYDDPDGAAGWVRANHPRARVVAVTDRQWFNLSEARNLGAAAASGDWLFFADADVHVAPDFVRQVQPLLQPGVYLLANPRPADLWGALVVSRADFEAAGGYDEAIEGYGSEDVDLIARLLIAGVREASFDGGLLTAILHDHKTRTRFYERTDIALSASINGFYRTAKNDLLRQGLVLDLEARRRLHADVARAFTAPGGAATFQIGFRQTQVPGLTVNASLRYDFAPLKRD
jgi:glycosyltransferase involved in cell wall biosynthesis